MKNFEESEDKCCCGENENIKEHCHEHEEHECCHNHEHEEAEHKCHCHDHHSHGGPEISCGCGHCHDEDEEEEGSLKKLIAAFVLFAAGILIEHIPFFEQLFSGFSAGEIPMHRALYLLCYFAAYLFCGKEVIKSAVKNISHGEIFDEKFLMTVASLGAIFVGEVAEAVAVMLFYNIGEWFQDYAVDKSRRSISALMDIRPDKAFVVRNGKVEEVSPEDVECGEIIEVKPGERVPLDGVVEEGNSFMDTSALTGENVPRRIQKDDEILAGFVNQNGVVRIKVTKVYGESAVARILELTENAGSVKAKSEKFITRFARVYTPVVCVAAALVAAVPPLVAGGEWTVWIYRALMFLVVSCPCALVISVPMSFFSGIGAAGKHGVLVKGSNFIEALSKVETAVFDKTGTLTKGTFEVRKVLCAGTLSEDELIEIAAHAEYFSGHPVAVSVKTEHGARKGSSVDKNGKCLCDCCENSVKENIEETGGLGISIVIDGKKVLAGNEKLMKREEIELSELSAELCGTVVHVAVDGKYEGCILISDEIKKEASSALKALKKLGIKKTVMLTGDNQEAAKKVSEQLGLDSYFAGLLPEGKVEAVEKLINEKTQKKSAGTVMFAGDGVNDSPVLARADVGVAMGALGSDAAIEAADVVIMDDNPEHLAEAIKISRSVMAVVRQNIWLSIGVKAGIMILSGAGLSNMWAAVFADVGVCFIAILNSMRLLGK